MNQKMIGQNLHFKNLTRDLGLTSYFITTIGEDDYGYMWFGTNNGLNRYDGKEIKTFKNIQDDINSLNSNFISNIFYTSSGKLLVANSKGLSIYDYKNERFSRYEPLNSISIRYIHEDVNENVWIVTSNNVILKYDKHLNKSSTFSFDELIKNKLNAISSELRILKYDKDNFFIYVKNKGFYLYNILTNDIALLSNHFYPGPIGVHRVLKISNTEFWIGNMRGVFIYKNGVFVKHLKAGSRPKELNNIYVQELIKKGDNEVWIFTDGGGINVYNLATKKIKYIKQNVRDDFSLGSNFLYAAYISKDGTLWVGTVKNGVSQLIADNPFNTYKLRDLKDNVRSDYPASSLFIDAKERVWVGSDGNGLYRLNDKKVELVSKDVDMHTIPSINEHFEGQLLLGTYKNGVYLYDIEKHILKKEEKINTLLNSSSKVTLIGKDNRDNIYIGAGKTIFVSKRNQIKNSFINPVSSPLNAGLFAINNESKEFTLLGTFGSLFKYNDKGLSLISEVPNGIKGIIHHENSLYWLATNSGLCLIDIDTKEVNFFDKEAGLNSNSVNALIKDDSNNLWLGTTNGISRFNTTNKTFTNYTYEDGFVDNEFKNPAVVKDNNGRLYFGGLKGVLTFHPDSLNFKAKAQDVTFTKILVNHELLQVDDIKTVKGFIADETDISLQNSQKVLTIGFSTFEHAYPDKIKFKYKLSGFDDNWKLTSERSLTYMNLDPGDYQLQIIASNTSGEFSNNISKLNLTVVPAWWQTIWFRFLIMVIIVGIVVFINLDLLRREKIKRKYNFEKATLEKQLDMDEQQLRFFTNLSHEIKTPLSLIISPIEEIIKKQNFDDADRNNLILAQKNAQRIKRLTNRGIDFRKTQFKDPELQAEELNIILLLKELIVDFSSFMNHKNLKIRLEIDSDEIMLWYDAYMMESIFYNLLSNAVKYSFPDGEIVIRIEDNKKETIITVQDFGRGISENDLIHVLERFYQSKEHSGGSGIGLALVKKLISAHKGTINVQSKLNEGSSFEIKILKGTKHLEKSQLSNSKLKNQNVVIEKPSQNYQDLVKEEVQNYNCTVLIVEDEASLNQYLKNNLSGFYKVLTAENGLEGLEILKNEKVDIIISDVMMPVMDGFEFCEKLKNNPKTNSIPLILLTAKNLGLDRKEGYDKGADAYIEKPFELDVLKSRINNLLESRKKLKKKFLELLNIDLDKNTINNSNDEFYKQSIQILENNISNVEFDISLFARELGMSKSLIYKRMSEITNLGINEMMLKIRLNRASQLLLHTKKTIQEITILVGFSNAKYFSTCFKKQYSETPSSYRKNNQSISKRIVS